MIFSNLLLSEAQSATIVNLDSQPRVFELETASGYQAVTIAPSGVWRLPGRVKIRYDGREMYMNEDDEYAMWKNNEFGPQRRIRSSTGVFNR